MNLVPEQSDYERIGGAPAVSAVVDRFYQRVLADPALTHFFVGVDLPRLKRHQVLMVSQVLGGPARYDGRNLAEAHASLQIGGKDFDRVVSHLVSTMREVDVPAEIIGRVGDALAGTEKDIVTSETI